MRFYFTRLLLGGLLSLLLLPSPASAESDYFTGLIVSWKKTENSDASLWLRTREVKSGKFTEWYRMESDEDGDEHKGIFETLFSTNPSSEVQYEVRDDRSGVPGIYKIQVEKIRSTGEGAARLVAGLAIPSKFSVITRAQWGADEELTFTDEKDISEPENFSNGLEPSDDRSVSQKDDPEILRIVTHDTQQRRYSWPLEYRKETKFLVIHHTASVKNLDNPKTAIQNIFYYHAIKRGWGDIGYHYVIAPNGQIYEGRKGGDDVIGGHARPVNKVSLGIAVLGNYEADDVPAPVLTSLMSLIEAKAKKYEIPINGQTTYKDKTYPSVHGHGTNTPTACPGVFLEEKIAAMRGLITYDVKKEKDTPATYAFSDIDNRAIILASADKKKSFTVRLKNTGSASWSQSTFIENATETAPLPKILAKLDGSSQVRPGEIGVFKGSVPQVSVGGFFVPQGRLVVNGTARVDRTLPIPILAKIPNMSYEVVEVGTPPANMKPGQKASFRIVLKNTGDIIWKRAGKQRIRLGTTNPQDRKSVLFKGKNRVATLMQSEVKPGGTGTFLIEFEAPRVRGTFREHLAPVIENVRWLSDKDISFKVTIDMSDKPLRVAISTKKTKPRIASATGMKLSAGTKKIGKFTPNEGATVTLLKTGGYSVTSSKQKFTLDKPPRFEAEKNGVLQITNFENRPAWNKELNDNTYRGILEVAAIDKKLKVINELPLEDYLKGIAEVSNGDPPEKIKTLMILARSYAQYYRDQAHKFPGKPYDLDDDPDHTQKYLGYGLELRTPNVVQAVEETTGLIVTYKGKPVITPYFNQSDGRTHSAQEVWGWTNTPYLISVPDTACSEKVLKGHGVGLSGCGATGLARQGKKAEEIIKYYYTGVEVEVK